MPNENIYAYTEPGLSYPGYISLNVRDGKNQLTVRNPGNNGTEIATIALSDERLLEMADAIYQRLRPL